MFRKNRKTQQPLLLSDVNELSHHKLEILRGSWAETFRQEVFLRIPEDIFAVLYNDKPSRPNIPVNVLVGLEILKAWRGWTDEELHQHFLFDLQVRYALGCDNFGEDDFDIRTLYNFRRRLAEYALETGVNLLKAAFEHITDEQIKKLDVKTEIQRMDSTQLMSNIADLSRLELLVNAMQRLYRMLNEEDKAKYDDIFQPYIKQRAGQYTYRIHGKEAVWEHIEEIGKVLHGLLRELEEKYQAEPIYQIAQRFFDENFKLVETEVKAKTNKEIEPGCLQSLDDREASYRVKGGRAYKGYVANITETCDPDNQLQIITEVQVEPNRTGDTKLLKEALPGLKKRTNLKKLINDGAFISQEIDELLRKNGIEQITTSLTGTLPGAPDGKLALSDFELELDEDCRIIKASCPLGHPATITQSASGKTFRLLFDPQVCKACAYHQNRKCPIRFTKRKGRPFLSVTRDRAISYQRRKRFEQHKEEARNLRTGVESTVFQLKHPLRGGKARVRGLFRITMFTITAALAVNLRRIHRYKKGKRRGKNKERVGKQRKPALMPV